MRGSNRRRAPGLYYVLFLACAPVAARAQSVGSTPPPPTQWTYTVRPGDTLWDLGRTLLARPGEWPEIQRVNRLPSADRLVPGMRLQIPFDIMRIRPVPARALATSGNVTVIRGDGLRGVLAAEMSLYSGDAVETGANGSASVIFADGSSVLLGANARLVFDRLASFGATGMVDTRLRLDRGRARPNVVPRRGRFQIWSPALQVTTRGTEFRVESADAGSLGRVEVTESEVDAEAGAIVPVPEGSGTFARVGEAPAPPVPLLPAPLVGSPQAPVRRLPVRITVQPVAGASGYHWEVGPDATFRWLLAETMSRVPILELDDLPDGAYAVRVRAVDALGLEGRDGTGQIQVDARPVAPFLMTPVPAAVLRVDRPALSWAQPAGAAGFRVQVSASPSFDAPVVDVSTPVGQTFAPSVALQPGTYSWRVATLADGEEGPFGDAQQFVVRRLPPRLTPERPDVGAPVTVLRWPAATEPNVRYHAQLARDAQFASLISEHMLDVPEVSLPRPAPGAYFVRVRVLESDGYEGAFGEPQSFDVPAGVEEAPPKPRRSRWLWLLPAAAVIAGVAILL